MLFRSFVCVCVFACVSQSRYSTFGSVTINTQFSPVSYQVGQGGGFVGGPGANTITGNIANSPNANFIVAGMTVTGANLVGVTTVTSATVDMSGNFTIITDADEVDPFAFGEAYTFTGAEPQDRNWEFNSLGGTWASHYNGNVDYNTTAVS